MSSRLLNHFVGENRSIEQVIDSIDCVGMGLGTKSKLKQAINSGPFGIFHAQIRESEEAVQNEVLRENEAIHHEMQLDDWAYAIALQKLNVASTLMSLEKTNQPSIRVYE
jgi:hypothetical protein